MYASISVCLTFLFLALSGIYFRLEDLQIATGMLTHIFTDRDWSVFGNWMHDFKGVFAVICAVLLVHWTGVRWYAQLQKAFIHSGWFVHALLLVLAIFIAYQISGMEPIPFIYQKF